MITIYSSASGTSTHYEVMTFPGEGIDGGYAYNVRISSGKTYWTSPMVQLSITDRDEANREIARQVKAFVRSCENLPEEMEL